MIRFDRVTVTYDGAPTPALADVDLEIPEGELCLAVGPTGSGKSTLLRAVNGLVPRFSGGHLAGTVSVDGRSTATYPPRDLADVVGYVGQDPAGGFVTDTVEEELAYVMENLGVDAATMRRRVEDALDLLGLARLRDRPLQHLSSGERQRVAIGAALTAHPRALVLDEPTSALDPGGAEEVLAALTRLVHDVGTTVLLAEHRLERVVGDADAVVVVHGARAERGAPATMLARAPVAPPVVELGRLCHWDPVPLSVRDARRAAADLRRQLDGVALPAMRRAPGEVAVSARHVSAAYGRTVVLDDLDLEVRHGELVAVMGRNGSGKSTLLALIAGLRTPNAGRLEVAGLVPSAVAPRELVRQVGLVPSDPGLLLYRDTVRAECAAADGDTGLAPGTTAALAERLVPGLDPQRHPRDLSEGQRLGLALAVVLAAGPPVLLLDEPTRGLDYDAKRHLAGVLDDLVRAGHAVVVVSHDVEFVARVADRAVVLADSHVVADGPARDVVCHSPVLAPQVAKVLAPAPWMTVDEVAAALQLRGVP